MADELDLDLDDNNEEIISRKDKRIESLSEKYKLSEKEKAELETAKAEAEARAEAAKKEADFFKGFNQVASKYPDASEYQDKILEKVNSGYAIEDATTSILIAEGKYKPIAPPVDKGSAAGGSASTGIIDGVEKTPDKMTREEMREQLLDLEAKGEFNKL
jgi:hypothetical protein